MIEWTLAYLTSQILTIIIYICLCSTYFLKSRKKILVLNVVAHIIQIIAFVLLGGLTGAAMNARKHTVNINNKRLYIRIK